MNDKIFNTFGNHRLAAKPSMSLETAPGGDYMCEGCGLIEKKRTRNQKRCDQCRLAQRVQAAKNWRQRR